MRLGQAAPRAGYGNRSMSRALPGAALLRSTAPVRLAAAAARGRAAAVQVRAVAATERSTDIDTSKRFTLPKNSTILVEVSTEGDVQVIRASTDLEAGRLLLHWGLEGGKDYKGGWRLPGDGVRPEGTKQYKDRALQTPFRPAAGGRSEVVIRLPGDEASDTLNFVLKDDATDTWYDHHSTNFAVPLRPERDDIPDIPRELCDTWAWIKWDHGGRPQRGMAQANREYDAAVEEMETLLRAGRPLDELHSVARGELLYGSYKMDVIDPLLGDGGSSASSRAPVSSREAADPSKAVVIPDALVSVQAYVMWEHAGKPQGADFGAAARNLIEEKLRSGLSLQQIEDDLKNPNKGQDRPAAAAAAPAKPAAAPAAAAPARADGKEKEQREREERERAAREEEEERKRREQQQKPVEVGQSLGTAARNPLQMIKKTAPPSLSEDKRVKQIKPLDFLVQRAAVDGTTRWRRVYQLGSKAELLAVIKQQRGEDGDGAGDGPISISLTTDSANDLVLHWGITKQGSRDWKRAPKPLWPDGTEALEGGIACETVFEACNEEECDVEVQGAKVPLQRVQLVVPADTDIGGLTFVLRSEDSTRWYRDADSNFFVPLPTKGKEVDNTGLLEEAPNDVWRVILNAEVNSFQWTLMHRFHKASDIINEVLDGFFEVDTAQALADVYVWLRYSSTRQLTWQRNYNTQPRILSAAQERLTRTIAEAHKRSHGEGQEWVRMMLTTVGRGGDGQRIRDEILHIMHRNRIPEVKGTWMEEWHQKLHNNTTPDDVPICAAYIAFLESDGDEGRYWRVLSDAGITRERLESFDRPIRTRPEFWRDKKGALISEFRNYLGILKSVHSGADLQASAAAVGSSLPQSARGYLGYVTSHIGDSQVLPFIEAAVEARTEIASSVTGNKDLLYLDLALEGAVRQAAERGAGAAGFGGAALMAPLLQNLCLSLGDNEEACFCLKAWQGLPTSVRYGGRPSREEALQAVAVTNRIRRLLGTISDGIVERISPFATTLGRATGCDAWAVEIFAEEVVRGGPAFAISLLISSVEPSLRAAAELGAWQVISPAEVTGRVVVVPHLSGVQDEVYEDPTVLVVETVTGEEEIPEGCVAVLTPDAPDVLSHVSVRARNMKVLFATCHDEEPLNAIRGAQGQYLHFSTTAAGAVTWVSPSLMTIDSLSGVAAGLGGPAPGAPRNLRITIPKWCGKWAVGMDEFKEGVVGAKSRNIANLRGRLPEWVKLPAAVTVPFGSFEKALDDPANAAVKRELAATIERLKALAKQQPTPVAPSPNGDGGGEREGPAQLLARAREIAMGITVPAALREQLGARIAAAGIPVPEDEARWGLALDALKGVWASKYNDRAFYSLRKCGIDSDDVRMAVCVMRVVPARYAFVIHTKNPQTNDSSEIFAELVKGLGESLVSGMVPGSSIAFTARKDALDDPHVLSYASKSEGMFVRESLIFRSDSNGEDLEGYAGAGLYESITMDPSNLVRVDYSDDPITADPGFRNKVMSDIVKVGAAIEAALGSAQDIEGVVDPDGAVYIVQTRPQV
ncbi:MAG: R1 protein [Monoraphidium minutum]|nr:MAG: R1 protein [Monoraphidium minutum]